MRTAKPILARIASVSFWHRPGTPDSPVTEAELRRIIADYPFNQTDCCIAWRGRMQRITPMLKVAGRLQPVRRLLMAEIVGGEPSAGWQPRSRCGILDCINPMHTRYLVKWCATPDPLPIKLTATAVERPADDQFDIPMDEELSINDVVDCIYMYESRDPGWLAEKIDEPIHRVKEALAIIESGAA
jgi:hypothetical protein